MSVKKTALAVSAVALLAAASGAAQSNEVVDRVLQQDELHVAEALYLVQVASGRVDEDVSVQDVYDRTMFGFAQKGADEPVTLGEFSYIVMSSLEMSGGIMYSLSPGPRYAARELAYLGHIASNGSPYRTLSGNEALRILGSVLRDRQ